METEYIEKQAVLDEIDEEIQEFPECEYALSFSKRWIKKLPPADVRPVVLCRDCKHSEQWYGDKSRCFMWHESGIDVFNDGFCNYGIKSEES